MTVTTRNTRRRDATRRALLDAARATLTRTGYDGATIGEIAGTADVGVGTFYLHFEDKKDLLVAFVDELVTELRAYANARLVGIVRLEDHLAEAVRAIFDFVRDRPDIAPFLFAQPTMLDPTTPRPRHALLAALVEDLSRLIARAVRAGEVRAVDPVLTAQALVGMVDHVVMWWAEDPTRDPEPLVSSLLELGLDGIRAAEGRGSAGAATGRSDQGQGTTKGEST